MNIENLKLTAYIIAFCIACGIIENYTDIALLLYWTATPPMLARCITEVERFADD